MEYRRMQCGEYAGSRLNEERISALNEIGMEWRTLQEIQWDEAYSSLEEYYKENNSIEIPRKFRTKSGFKLGVWLYMQRKKYLEGQLSDDRVRRLDSIDPKWKKPIRSNTWDDAFLIAKNFYLNNGNLKVPKSYYINGLSLNSWVSSQRVMYHKGKLSIDRKTQLDSIGMDWNLRAT